MLLKIGAKKWRENIAFVCEILRINLLVAKTWNFVPKINVKIVSYDGNFLISGEFYLVINLSVPSWDLGGFHI
jgi:hypothetical protein